MDNTMERLTEILRNGILAAMDDDNRYLYTDVVDYMMAHGVTLDNQVSSSKWIPVTERLPQEDEPEATTCEQVQVLLDNGVVSTGWCNRHYTMWWHLNYGETHFIGYDYEHTPVVAWQPLSQPPKGE